MDREIEQGVLSTFDMMMQRSGAFRSIMMAASNRKGALEQERGLKMETERQIFTDVFNFFKDNYKVQGDQDYWKRIVEQTTEIEQRYKGNRFAANLLYACTKRLCEIYDDQGDTANGR